MRRLHADPVLLFRNFARALLFRIREPPYSFYIPFLSVRALFLYAAIYSTISLFYYLIPIFSALLSRVRTHRSTSPNLLTHHYFSFYFFLSLSLSPNFLSLLQVSSLILAFFHNFPTYLFSVFPFIWSINVYQMDTTKIYFSTGVWKRGRMYACITQILRIVSRTVRNKGISSTTI